MPSIHLIEKIDKFKIADSGLPEWESGDWRIRECHAQKLVGGNIYLHRGQLLPSFKGGQILGYRPTKKGKVAFRFKELDSHSGISTEKSGWGNEQKRVWD